MGKKDSVNHFFQEKIWMKPNFVLSLQKSFKKRQ